MAKKVVNEEVYEEVITEAEPEVEEGVFEAEVEDAAPKKKINAKSVLKKIGKGVGIGLLIGASVGAGFAAFESAGYALQPVLAYFQNSGYYAAYGRHLDMSIMLDAINQSVFIRGFLAPGGHVTWAAISGAGMVIAAEALRRLDTTVLTDMHFIRLFAIPVVLHAIWDSPLANIGLRILLVPLTLTAIVWIVVLILINMGLSEVERAERAYIKRHMSLP